MIRPSFWASLDGWAPRPALPAEVARRGMLPFAWVGVSVDEGGVLLVHPNVRVDRPNSPCEIVRKYVMKTRRYRDNCRGRTAGRTITSTGLRVSRMGRHHQDGSAFGNRRVDDMAMMAQAATRVFESRTSSRRCAPCNSENPQEATAPSNRPRPS